ncbi:MAG: heavy metal transporter [Chloroflexi bacterium HGW-Chloroflexi-2]|jgi:copper chaperone CopZ|nr:MAG: heavy metal transporter [Chloroflexi bacterium HGW-Chloroflexi-2]
MTEITLNVPNISCGHCVHTIQTELVDLDGVKKVVASAQTKQVTVSFEQPADTVKIKALLQEINYPAGD